MNVTTLAKTMHTFKDWELRELMKLLEPDAKANGGPSKSKFMLCKNELNRRAKAKKQGKYVDQTLNPKVPIHKRELVKVQDK